MSNTSTNEEPVLTDEQILEFEQQIKDEEARKNLNKAHDKIRKCRGDGKFCLLCKTKTVV
ncbi:hypothetical protein PS6_009859 [Mucor atramentarius]